MSKEETRRVITCIPKSERRRLVRCSLEEYGQYVGGATFSDQAATQILHINMERSYILAVNHATGVLNDAIRKKGKITADDLDDAFRLSGNENRWQILNGIMGALPPGTPARELSDIIRYCYISGRPTKETAYNLLFEKYPDLDVSDTDGRRVYEELPPNVEIYRGCNTLEKRNGYGLSWTLRRDVAEFFAFRHVGDTFPENRAVYKTTIRKTDVRAVFMERNEHEIIYYCPDGEPVVLVADKPTEYYYNFMEWKQNLNKQYGKEENNTDNGHGVY